MISVSDAYNKASRLNSCASDLRGIKSNLSSYKSNLNQAWQGQEMNSINSALDDLIRELGQQASAADSIASDIRTAAQEIRREEEAAEEARRRAASLAGI